MFKVLTFAFVVLLAGCAATPEKTVEQLNRSDPRYNSPNCQSIRTVTTSKADKTGQFGLAAGFGYIAGPIGIPLAASVLALQDEERKLRSREIIRQCMTGGDVLAAEQDQRDIEKFKDLHDRMSEAH